MESAVTPNESEASPVSARPDPPKTIRILAIDDDYHCRRLYERQLEKLGYTAIIAAGGKEGFEVAERTRPEGIILDLTMPGVNGFLVLQALKAHPATTRIPVLIVTGHLDPGSLLKAAADGQHARGFLRKPYTFTELAINVAAILSEANRGAASPPSENELNSQVGSLRYLRRGCVIIDLFEKRLWVAGRSVTAPTERRFDLLCILLRSEGPISRKKLLLQLWGEEHEIGIVGITIMRLRKDLCANSDIYVASSRDGYELIFQTS